MKLASQRVGSMWGNPTRFRCRKLPVTNFGVNGGGKRGRGDRRQVPEKNMATLRCSDTKLAKTRVK